MKKASSSFLLLAFATLLVSFQSYAQISVEIGRPGRGQNRPQPQPLPQAHNEVIREQVSQTLRPYQRVRLIDLMRLSPYQERSELLSLRLMAESLVQGPAQLEISERGRILAVERVKRNLNEVAFIVPIGTRLESLELTASADIFISSLSAEISSDRYPQPGPGYETQVTPHSLITLQVNQSVYGRGVISLDQLARQQLGVTLEGAQIERVVVEGQPSGYSRQASVQVEMNHRLVSDIKFLGQGRQLPLPVSSLEEVRTLNLIVSGDAHIMDVRIRVGQVRPRLPEYPRAERVVVRQEILPRAALHLSSVLPYEARLVRSITVEGRATRQIQAMLSLVGIYGEHQGSGVLSSGPSRATIVLRRPMPASELRLEVSERALIDSLEIEFETHRRY